MEWYAVIRDLWGEYSNSPDAIVGIFTSIGAIFTVLVFLFTARAANAAKNSAKVAVESLLITQMNNQRDDFTRQFTLLLEQHNIHLEIVKNYLDENESGKSLLTELTKSSDHLHCFNRLRGHPLISPYMRVLYHLIRHIDRDFFNQNASLKERKKFSSLVRSLIRNDVLFLIAVNTSYVIENGIENDYAEYHLLLKKYSFFEHALFFNIQYDNSVNSRVIIHNIYLGIKTELLSRCRDIIDESEMDGAVGCYWKNKPTIPFIVAYIFDNPMNVTSRHYMNAIVWESYAQFIIARNLHTKEEPMNYYLGKYIGSYVMPLEFDFSSPMLINGYTGDIKSGPCVDNNFAEVYIANFKTERTLVDNNIKFVRFGLNNTPIAIWSMTDFENDCQSFIAYEKNERNLQNGCYMPAIKRCMSDWLQFKAAIREQSLPDPVNEN